MAEHFLQLSRADRTDAIEAAAAAAGRPAAILEKDAWVVWALDVLFSSAFAEHLVFKGGTSLSKAYHVITRFSEDVDITYDIREILPQLRHAEGEPLPGSRSEQKRLSDLFRERLPRWIRE